MDNYTIIISVASIIGIIVAYFIANNQANKKLSTFKSLNEALIITNKEYEELKNELKKK